LSEYSRTQKLPAKTSDPAKMIKVYSCSKCHLLCNSAKALRSHMISCQSSEGPQLKRPRRSVPNPLIRSVGGKHPRIPSHDDFHWQRGTRLGRSGIESDEVFLGCWLGRGDTPLSQVNWPSKNFSIISRIVSRMNLSSRDVDLLLAELQQLEPMMDTDSFPSNGSHLRAVEADLIRKANMTITGINSIGKVPTDPRTGVPMIVEPRGGFFEVVHYPFFDVVSDLLKDDEVLQGCKWNFEYLVGSDGKRVFRGLQSDCIQRDATAHAINVTSCHQSKDCVLSAKFEASLHADCMVQTTVFFHVHSNALSIESSVV